MLDGASGRSRILAFIKPTNHRAPFRRATLLYLITLVVAAVLTGACDETSDGPGPVGPVGPVDGQEEGIAGSGNITAETRELPDFERIVLAGEGTVSLSQAANSSLSIETDDNLHQYIVTEVAGGVLTISTAPNIDIAPSSSVRYQITIVEPVGMELTGAGAITAGTLTATSFDVILSGTGDISVDELQADELKVVLTGVGSVRLVGEVGHQEVEASGVVEYEGADLVSSTATVNASGSGSAIVHVTDELNVDAADSGTVGYYGSPTVSESVSDSGSVTGLGAR